MDSILYFTDRYKVSAGYEPAFTKMLARCGIPRQRVITTDIYHLVDEPLRKLRSNDLVWRFNPDKLERIREVYEQRIRAIKPSVIVVSCPAILGVLANGDLGIATLEKMRGGVYSFAGIPVIVTYPITAIHQRIDIRLVENDDGEVDKQQPYRVQQGNTILNWDWQKVGRFYQGKQRQLPPFKYSICRTLDDCFAARDYLLQCKLIAVDIETGNFPSQVTCVGYTGMLPNGATHSFVIPFYNEHSSNGAFWASEDDHMYAWAVVREINDSPVPKTLQNGPYDSSYFIRDRAPLRNYIFDSMVLWWSLYCELPKSLDFISSVLLDNYQYWKDDIKGQEQERVSDDPRGMETYWRYCALDCYNTLFNTCYLNKLMSHTPAMQHNYSQAMMRLFSGLRMSMRGTRADFKRRDYHRDNLIRERDEAIARFRYLIDDDAFNINSPDQKVSLLYDVFGLRPMNDRGRPVERDGKGKGKAPSAGAIPLKLAKTEHPLFKYVIESLQKAMEPDKQISIVFGKKDPETGKISGGIQCPSGRFLTYFSAVGTETNRFSSKKSAFWNGGNAQNIRGKYRDWVQADPNHIFLDIDYSQSDDVFMAYESQDPDKIAVVESGKDGHAVNGELFFGMPYEQIVAGKEAKDPLIVHPTTGIRQLAKRIVHGTNFQMAAMTLYVTMGRDAVVAAAELLGYADAARWSQDRLVQICEKLMLRYRGKYRRLTRREYYADVLRELKQKRSMTNAFGSTRIFLGDPEDNGTQREATAYIGQSDTADNMNRVMYEIDWGYIPKTFRDGPNPCARETPLQMDWRSHGIGFHLQVHDNFVSQLNLQHPRWKEAAYNLLQVMDRPVVIKGREVRIRAEAEVGLRWGKNMLAWNGDIRELDSLVEQLQHMEN